MLGFHSNISSSFRLTLLFYHHARISQCMALQILSFFNENVTWQLAQTPDGYFHRELAGPPDWHAGLPSEISLEMVKKTFQQFPSTDHSLEPSQLSFKMTYRIGHSNMECFVFSSPEGDPFSVKISPSTFATLQDEFPSNPIPRMRVARLAVQLAIVEGLPSLELLPGTPVYETLRLKVADSFPPKNRR